MIDEQAALAIGQIDREEVGVAADKISPIIRHGDIIALNLI